MPRPLVVVLQSRQPLTIDPSDAFPTAEYDVVVLTDGDPDRVLREDVTADPPLAVRRDRCDWRREVGDRMAGRPVEVVTNDEYCLTECARLRASLGLASRHPGRPDAYHDKITMKRTLRAAGVPVPRFFAFEPVVTATRATLRHVLDDVGVPAVAKPRRESNSRGVRVLTSVDELTAWLDRHEGEPGWQVDEFVDGRHGHVDGLVRRGVVTPVLVGRYLGPLGVEDDQLLGGATVPPGGTDADAAHELNARVVAALGADGDFCRHPASRIAAH